MKEKKAGNKKKTALIIVACVVAAFFLVLMPVATIIVNGAYFGNRMETVDWMTYSVDDFEGLNVTECVFPSNNGQSLAGYRYSRDNQKTNGVVVIAHGLGAGHNTYMDVANYFTSNGYLVFAYDVTGNDKSEGDSIEGLPQGVIDLDYALQYVKAADEYKDLPIVLFGHSWGGYSVGSVLNCHKDVEAAVLVAGFDRSIELFEQQGEDIAGPVIKLFVPYFSLYERIKFGEYATYSAIDGFESSDADIMVIHSRDDETVRAENGYDKFYSIYADNPRFLFVEYEDRGHGYLYYTDAARGYKDQLLESYAEHVEANGGESTAEIKSKFMMENLDKSRSYEFDEALMQRILRFYDSACREQ